MMLENSIFNSRLSSRSAAGWEKAHVAPCPPGETAVTQPCPHSWGPLCPASCQDPRCTIVIASASECIALHV